jgi:hypothetical protein
MEIIKEIVQGMIESKLKEIPISHIKHSFKESGIKWSKNIEAQFIAELQNKGYKANIESYSTHIVNIKQKGNNKIFKLN